MTRIGLTFPPDQPPERIRPVAEAADRAGLEELWLWEDCFKESGIATAASMLAWTDRLRVGIGLLPAPLRNVALTAMELATIERVFPGRLMPAVGHGVQEWMDQVGARVSSPMTLLREYVTALRALLHGERLTEDGRYVRLTDVALDWPPPRAPRLLVGAVRDKTVRLAGEVADGVLLPGETTPARVRETVALLEPLRDPERSADIAAFLPVETSLGAAEVAERIAGHAEAGATQVILLAVGADDIDLAGYADFVARDVRPLVH